MKYIENDECQHWPEWFSSLSITLVPEGRQFDFQSRPLLKLQDPSPVGAHSEATNQCVTFISMFLSLSPFLPL